MKLITHILVFLVGAGAGIWWGVNHPTDAARIADTEQLRAQQALSQTQAAINKVAPK